MAVLLPEIHIPFFCFSAHAKIQTLPLFILFLGGLNTTCNVFYREVWGHDNFTVIKECFSLTLGINIEIQLDHRTIPWHGGEEDRVKRKEINQAWNLQSTSRQQNKAQHMKERTSWNSFQF